MSIFKKRNRIIDASDAGLVMASLGGDRDAFCQIVTRYQNLLCSLAYSSVGDLKHSEDIAQEAFIEAWKKLDTLNDPEKLKSWLCGILRFKASHFRRKEATQSVKGADELDELDEHASGYSQQVKVEDAAISAQEQALLWQALEKMPETYREPLILFYREHCSVEFVASQLDLSEDTVKQRLSRGRKLLQKAMVTFVENTLAKSTQGAVFTLAVMVAINSISPPVKAAALGAGAMKTGSLFAWGGVAIAPISVGIISIGLISVGAVGIGLFGLGTIGIGIIGFGASAIGYKAYASFSALGWNSAFSGIGFSIANEAAIGPFAFAKHINNEQAGEIVNLTVMGQSCLWILAMIAILVIVPAVLHSNKVRQRMRKK